MAEISLAQNKSAEGAALIARQIEKNPKSPSLYLLQGELYLRSKQPDLAQVAFSKCLELDRKNTSALTLLADSHIALNQPNKAIEDYKQALELAPQNVSLYVALGSLYENQGNWQSARDNYQKAHDLQPDDPYAANNLAYILLQHGGDANVALTLAQTARKGLPNLANSADTLGWAYYHVGAYSAAQPLFEAAVKDKPNDQTYHLHLGLTYQKLQDRTRAKTELEKVVSLDPKSSVADQARQAMSQLASG